MGWSLGSKPPSCSWPLRMSCSLEWQPELTQFTSVETGITGCAAVQLRARAVAQDHQGLLVGILHRGLGVGEGRDGDALGDEVVAVG